MRMQPADATPATVAGPRLPCGLLRAEAPPSQWVLPQRPSRLATAALRWLGWRNDFVPQPGPRGLYVVYPHTSNWDFALGLLYKWSHALRARFWIKDSVLRIPVLGSWIRWVGGVGINRSAPTGVVEQTMRQMRDADFFWMVIAPEGTRSYTEGWRLGFYHLWQTAQCPLGLAYIDYANRQIGVQDYVLCSGDMEADFAGLARYYAGRHGRHPQQQAPIRPFSQVRKKRLNPAAESVSTSSGQAGATNVPRPPSTP